MRTEADPKPEYTVLDCEGRPLALFVQRLDLVMSPNAMWQSHTPERMARAIAKTLELDERALLDAMFPGMENGVIEAGFELDFIRSVARRVALNQYKRLPPIVAKLSHRTINQDFRYLRSWGK